MPKIRHRHTLRRNFVVSPPPVSKPMSPNEPRTATVIENINSNIQCQTSMVNDLWNRLVGVADSIQGPEPKESLNAAGIASSVAPSTQMCLNELENSIRRLAREIGRLDGL